MHPALSSTRIAALVALAAVGAALFFFGSDKPQSSGPPDLYSILGVDSDASIADVKAAYRKLAVKLHPDKNPGCSTCALEFSEVAKAYEVLSEPDRRQQ
jgi:preprotein translocase subunit Sec63